MSAEVGQDTIIKWGVVGTGAIAAEFVEDLRLVSNAEVVAVASRAADTARAFAERFGIARCHGSYDGVFDDDEVDVIYVATPHSHHYAPSRSALESGKHVLCEKTFTSDRAQADDLIRLARSKGLFLMEAMWTRFLPHMRRIRELVAAGAIGEIRVITADFGMHFVPDAQHRVFSPDLGGGALLDLGIYPLSLSSMLLGPPQTIQAVSTPAFTGVDASTTVLLTHSNGAHSLLTCTVEADTPGAAVITGTHGRIEVEPPFYAPTSFVLKVRGRTERFTFENAGIGLNYEAEEVGRCLRRGLTESPIMPLDETSSIMGTIDMVRAQTNAALGYARK